MVDTILTEYVEHDLDEDAKNGGHRGLELASYADRRYGIHTIEEAMQILEEQRNQKRWRQIVLRPFFRLEPGEVINSVEYKRRLGELKTAGYPVPVGYWSLRKGEAKNLYHAIQRDLTRTN